MQLCLRSNRIITAEMTCDDVGLAYVKASCRTGSNGYRPAPAAKINHRRQAILLSVQA